MYMRAMNRPRFLGRRSAFDSPVSITAGRTLSPFAKWSGWQKGTALTLSAGAAVLVGALVIRVATREVWNLVSVIN